MSKSNIVKKWRDAATLIVAARSSQNAYKVLMLKRSPKSSFMPNAYVFPGGVSSSFDFTDEWNHVFKKNNYDPSKRISNLLNLPSVKKPFLYNSNIKDGSLAPEVAFRICALRETFEESGILLVRDKQGKCTVLDDPNLNIGGKYDTLKGWRDKINEDAKYFLELFRHMNISPNISSLFDWSTWLTPTFPNSKRFDTLFYICFIDDIPIHGKDCGDEVTDTVWFNTSDIPLNSPPPQLYEMQRLSRCSDYVPDISALYDWSTWLTPTFRKNRFNTMFYICFIDNALNQSEDNAETVHSDWLSPFDFLRLHMKKKIILQFPQIYENDRLQSHKTFDELRSFTEKREMYGLETWCPFKVSLRDGYLVTYPGDDYHNPDPYAESVELDVTVEELRNDSIYLNRVEMLNDKTMTIENNVDWCGHAPIEKLTPVTYKPIES